jgi:hypothetical protein
LSLSIHERVRSLKKLTFATPKELRRLIALLELLWAAAARAAAAGRAHAGSSCGGVVEWQLVSQARSLLVL